MPIVNIAGKLILFCHVPRCGGSAVEEYLNSRFGPLGLIDRSHLLRADNMRWNKSSPQHLDIETLYRLIPKGFFAERFALVRHPVDRIISVFRYQRDIEQKIPSHVEFDEWIAGLSDILQDKPYYLDNHPRPMTELIAEGASVFRLEDGMKPVVKWLDFQEGQKRSPRSIDVGNSYQQRIKDSHRFPGAEISPSPNALETIKQIYADDFTRFRYQCDSVSQTG